MFLDRQLAARFSVFYLRNTHMDCFLVCKSDIPASLLTIFPVKNKFYRRL